MLQLRQLFPFLQWRRPSTASFAKDAWAGISVGLVLVPQAIAYATLAGMPPATGLYAALLPSVIGVLWGSSALLAVGPVALTSLLVFGSLAPMATENSGEWVQLAIWLALYSGLIQLLLGVFRLGKISNLVSQPVVTGFINAAALIVIFSQLPVLLGLSGLGLQELGAAWQTWQENPQPILLSSAFGGVTLVVLLLLKRFFPAFPGILLLTVLAIVLSWQMDFAGHGGAVIGAIPSGLPGLSMPPPISLSAHRELWPAALILALISFTEAMSSCRVLARVKQERWDENQELIGQGLAKIASGFSGSFAVSGSFSRSALNLYAGATSAWSTLFSVACVLLSLLFLTEVLQYLPKAVLAAMIIVPVLGLFDLARFRRCFTISRDDGAVALITFLVTVISMPRMHWGVFAGIGLTMASYLYRRTRPRIIEVSLHPDGTMRDRGRFDLPPLAPDVLAVRMDDALNFLTGTTLERFVTGRCSLNPHIRRVLICAGPINDIDATGIETLESLKAALDNMGLELYFSAIKKQVWDVLDRAGLLAEMPSEHIFDTDSQAAEHLMRRPKQPVLHS